MGNYASVVLANKPIRYYRLSEVSGTTVLDQLSSANNGTITGGVTLNQPGLLTADNDTCMLFNGSSGYISLPTTGLPSGANAFTLEAWIKFSSVPVSGYSSIVAFGTATSNQSLFMYYHGAVNSFAIADWNTDLIQSTTAVANASYYVVATYNGTTIKLYVNGLLVSSTAIALNIVLSFARIGDDSAGDYFSGYIDEVAIYNATLSATQITNHYLAGIGALNFPVAPLTALARDGIVTLTARDGKSISTQTRN